MNASLFASPLLAAALVAPIAAQDSKPTDAGVHGFAVKRMDGSSAKLAEFAGKTVLIVNTASQCGLTPQYEGLQKLQETYENKGFTVLAFPANDFGAQEPGTNDEIAKFCKDRYSVTFPVFAKISVKGDEMAPLYQYLTKSSPFPGDVTWNFQKYLVDGTGHVVARFDPRVKPGDAKVAKAIEAALAGSKAAAPVSSAKDTIAAACKEAAASDRTVLVHFSADWCPWCKKLNAFLEIPEVKAIVATSYVPTLLTTDTMKDGEEWLQKYAEGKQTGIPFLVWLDGKGAVLERSFDAKGENIGYPGTPGEIDAFMALFAKHAKHTSKEQIAALRKALDANAPKSAGK